MRLFIKSRFGRTAIGGRLKLLLSGFSAQKMVPIDDIVHAIDRLPDFHLEGLREIAYLLQEAPPAGIPAYPRCDPRGEFVQAERKIFVYGFDDSPMFFHMLHH